MCALDDVECELAADTGQFARFVSRQQGSGTRLLLDCLLENLGLAGASIAGDDSAECAHAAVAAYVASGMADAGFDVKSAARRFNLEFIRRFSAR